MKVYTGAGTALELREPPMSSGGEGAIYEIVGYPKKLAKLYHDPQDAQKRERKINAMVDIGELPGFQVSHLSDNVAWPMAPLYNDTWDFVGFGMNRINASRELDDLYDYPPNRSADVTMEQRVDTLISLCSLTNKMHSMGQVIGDFNPNNIKIKPDWSVSFVDADSCHVRNNGQTYRCVVCAPGYVAPEVIKACAGTTYEDCPGTTFTQESDHFALAIHIFRMLRNGAHPYICERHLTRGGSAPAPISMDKRVERGETPFYTTVPGYGTPSYAPDNDAFPDYLNELWYQAFVDGHRDPRLRPDATQWLMALQRYRSELVACPDDPNHFHWKRCTSCPYCEADDRFYQRVSPIIHRGNNPAGGTGFQGSTSTGGTANLQPLREPGNSILFWFLTICLGLAVLMQISMYVVPYLIDGVFEPDWFRYDLCVYGSIVSGMIGLMIYNTSMTPGRPFGKNALWEYIVSILMAAIWAVGFTVLIMILSMVWSVSWKLLLAITLISAFFGSIFH